MKSLASWGVSYNLVTEKEKTLVLFADGSSSILTWRIPWTEEIGGLQSIVLQRVGHDWSDLARTYCRIGRNLPKVVPLSWTSLEDKGSYSHSYVFFFFFSSSHVLRWELDHKEGRAPKNWYFPTVVLENSKSPLDSKENNPGNPKGNQPWIFTGRTGAEAEAPILWSPDVKSWHIEKTLILGKIEDRRRRGWWRIRLLDGIVDTMNMSLSKLQKIVKDRKAWHAAICGVTESQIQLNDWTANKGQ